MSVRKLDRNIFQRLLGIPATGKPGNPESWNVDGRRVVIDTATMPELQRKNGAVRLEGKGLEAPVLVINGDDGLFHAFRNRCPHGKRSLDPVPGTGTIQCCSVGTSTFGYDGSHQHGPAKQPVVVYPVSYDEGRIIIML
ncbi:MAG: Rieske 2Fe-2S domain-containing protein [Chlorobi bacterium]|nr:Rieske 2Fe-2S domain-containing protein [Chlorobiota bacterium]